MLKLYRETNGVRVCHFFMSMTMIDDVFLHCKMTMAFMAFAFSKHAPALIANSTCHQLWFIALEQKANESMTGEQRLGKKRTFFEKLVVKLQGFRDKKTSCKSFVAL